jgi:hypothetical protein
LTIRILLVGLVLCGLQSSASAHWCSNIWQGGSRLVVKPERDTVYVGATATQFRVYLQNNFPMRLFGVMMQGSASGYTITVQPSAGQTIYPGQNAGFRFSVSKTGSAATVSVSTLNLQVYFDRVSWVSAFSDCLTNQSPTVTDLMSSCANLQSISLNTARVWDMNSSYVFGAGQPYFGRTGIQQDIHWFGYRFCYSSGGGWRCGSNNCPSAACPYLGGSTPAWWATNQDPQNMMRAGVEAAVRKTLLGSDLTAARDAAVNALLGTPPGSPIPDGDDPIDQRFQHKCLAAVIGGYLWQGAPSTSTFTAALAAAANAVPTRCQQAGLRALNGTAQPDCPGAACCSSGEYWERAACAAAEGLQGNNGPVTAILMAYASDGNAHGSAPAKYQGLYYSYMLAIATAQRKASGTLNYYPDAGSPLLGDGAPPSPDTKPAADTKPAVDTNKADTTKPPDQGKKDTTKPPDQAIKKDTTKPPDQAVKKDTKPTIDQAPKKDTKSTIDQAVKKDTTKPAGDVTVAGDTPVPAGDGAGDVGSPTADGARKAEASTKPADSMGGGCGCTTGARPEIAAALMVGMFVIGILIVIIRRRRS